MKKENQNTNQKNETGSSVAPFESPFLPLCMLVLPPIFEGILAFIINIFLSYICFRKEMRDIIAHIY